MLKIECDFCHRELDELGALLFGPPTETRVRKLHMCRNCYHEICTAYHITKIPNYKLPNKKSDLLNRNTICNSKTKNIDDTSFC